MKSYKEKLTKINTFIFDVDGVFTNGDMAILNGDLVRTINARDAYAVHYAAKMGYRILVITGGQSIELKNRLLEIGVEEVYLSSFNKINVYNKLKGKHKLKDEEVLYMGDDIPDYEVMKIVGLACCPQDACVEIKHISHYQSPFEGGRFCVRDIIEQTLRVQNKWFGDNAFEWISKPL